MRRLFALLSLVLLLPVAASAAAPRDWTKTVTMTPAGAYVIGNPKAKVRLVEYLSLTCPHCADFSQEAWPTIVGKDVKSGKLAFEVRHAIRDGYDFAATLLVRCEGPGTFFAATESYFKAQDEWLAKAASSEAPQAGLPPEQLLPKLAANAGLDKLAATRGVSAAKAQTCLAGPGDRAKVEAMAQEAWGTRKIGGTPSFLLNDQAIEFHGWPELQTKLDAALR